MNSYPYWIIFQQTQYVFGSRFLILDSQLFSRYTIRMNLKKLYSFLRYNPIITVLLIALALRIPLLNGSFWLDEAAQALESSRPLSQQFDIAPDFQPPLLHIIVHFLSIVAKLEWWLRLSSVISGLVMIYGTYEIGKKLWNRRTGILSALLLATSSFHIFYSQELRPYALAGMFAVVSWMFLVRLGQHKAVDDTKLLIFYTLCLIGGLFSTYLFPFLFITIFFTGFIIYPALRKKLVVTHSIASGVFLIWLPKFVGQLKVGSALRVATKGWDQVVSFEQWKAQPLTYGKLFYGVIELDVNLFFLVLSAIFGIWLCYLLFHYWKRDYFNTDKKSIVIIVSWLFVPSLLAWIVSFWVPVIQPKRLLIIQPALFLFLTAVAESHLSKETMLRHFSMLFVMTMLSIQLFATYMYYSYTQYQREDWRDLIQYIDQEYSSKNTAVLFNFDHPFSPWDWYDHQKFTTIATGTGTKSSLTQIDLPMQATENFDTILVFDYLSDLTDPQRFVPQWLESHGFYHSTVIDAGNIGFVRSYKKL